MQLMPSLPTKPHYSFCGEPLVSSESVVAPTCIATSISKRLRLFYDHLSAHAGTGRFVSRVKYRSGTSGVSPEPVWRIATFTPPPSLKPGDGVPLSPMVPELARRMPNVQKAYLNGFDCSPNSISETSVRGILPPSTDFLAKLSIHRSCWAGDAVTELYYFLCACPRLLELTNVAMVSTPTGASSSAQITTSALTCPTIVNLAVTDRNHSLFYLIPAGYVFLRKSLRRFFVITELDSVLSPNKGWPLIQNTTRFLCDLLTVLFIAPPYNLCRSSSYLLNIHTDLRKQSRASSYLFSTFPMSLFRSVRP